MTICRPIQRQPSPCTPDSCMAGGSRARCASTSNAGEARVHRAWSRKAKQRPGPRDALNSAAHDRHPRGLAADELGRSHCRTARRSPREHGGLVKLSVREAARLLQVAESKLYRWIEDGEIPCYIVNHQPLFSRAELLEWATVHRMPLSPSLFDDGEGQISLASAIEHGGVHDHIGGGDRESVLRAVVATLPIADPSERELVLSIMLAREKEASTAIGEGFAI